jgi:hypothetical protein
MSIWDDPEIKSAGNFVKFENVGDAVSGTITAITRATFADTGTVAPQLILHCDDGEERTLTAGQTRLKIALVEARPEVGDHLKVTLTQIEKRGGGKTLKHFDVQHTRGDAAKVADLAKPAKATKAAAVGGDKPPF